MPYPRPKQPPTPHRDAFAVHRAPVADDMSLAYQREGVGGYPLVLVHGYPETKRIWWRNVKPLADAGYEVISVPLLFRLDRDFVVRRAWEEATGAVEPANPPAPPSQ